MNRFKKKIFIIPVLISLICISYLIYQTFILEKTAHVNYTEFLKDKKNGNVEAVTINDASTLKIKLKNGADYYTDNPRTLTFKEDLLTSGISVKESNVVSLNKSIPSSILIICIFSIVIMLSKKIKVSSSMTSMEILNNEKEFKNKYKFSSVAGNEEAKESLNDIVDFLKNPDKYNKYGARMPKGIILYGEPGTGKTLLAKAVAGEAGVPFYAVSGSDFVQVYVGVGAARIRNLFKKAKSKGKAVIFIDEIDAIGKMRSSGKIGGSEERDQTLNSLLTEMSGFNDNEGIVVMAATNRLDVLDPALLRPGRFDRHVEVALPDASAREKIINLYLEQKPCRDIDIKSLSYKTAYFSGAKLESLINEAAIIAAKSDSDFITEEHIEKAYSITIAGYNKIVRDSLREEDRKITAYHEAGHALVSLLKLPGDSIEKVSIIPTSKGAGGYTLSIPADSAYINMQYLKNKIMVLLAGRASEELIFGEKMVTTGAYNDLNESTKIIQSMITEYGMGNSLGLLRKSSLGSLSSEASKEVIDECKAMVENLYSEVKMLLQDNKSILKSIAEGLLEKETLYGADLAKLTNIITPQAV